MANVEFIQGSTLRDVPARKRQHTDAVAYALVFSVCFIVFFWAMAIERLVPSDWRHLSAGHAATSLWSSAKEAAHRCTAIAFQG